MTRKLLLSGCAVVVGLIGLSGAVHGFLGGRWTIPADLTAQGAELHQLPKQVGEWVQVDERPLQDNAQRLLRCYGSTLRDYRNERTGDVISVAVLFGPRGPIAVHTPEVCYSSAGTEPIGQRERRTIPTRPEPSDFWRTRFRQLGETEPSLEVWYGWSDGGRWQAADRPRFWMTDSLYKLQLAGPPISAATGQSPCENFLQAFLPLLRPSVH